MRLKLLIGCYSDDNHKEALHLLEFDNFNKLFELLGSHHVPNPSYLVFSPDSSVIYTVNENHTTKDKLSAIQLNLATAEFKNVNQISAEGSDPCYISIDSKAKHVFAANYTDGTLCCASINKNGALGYPVQVISHKRDSLDQLHPKTHIHATVLSPNEDFLLVTNLGQDTITVYRYQPNNLAKPLDDTPFSIFDLSVGAGPRHLRFSENGKYVYVVGELDASLHVLSWENGNLKPIQVLKLMPDDYQGENSAADLHFGTGGKFLYISNRGDANQIIIFKVDILTGKAELLQRSATNGLGPRNFAISPSGDFMIIAHQHSNDLRVFEIDKNLGTINDTGIGYALHSPVCVQFL
ncbi:beta-propeller fold lactonase family protein [Pedobacter sp. LMG 31464]|uniref:Beta-propeller fold lactonase family protein n=1 Tax=Pedobacter planticolens TaxID=2679964 RepID=A0A923DXJ5_9SPHI|nr:lactonase family protein [Pedobacter planticolens]MBB2145894.1 beta-propeller fold lactonase family protein [Pedobacter planticolens]